MHVREEAEGPQAGGPRSGRCGHKPRNTGASRSWGQEEPLGASGRVQPCWHQTSAHQPPELPRDKLPPLPATSSCYFVTADVENLTHFNIRTVEDVPASTLSSLSAPQDLHVVVSVATSGIEKAESPGSILIPPQATGMPMWNASLEVPDVWASDVTPAEVRCSCACVRRGW